MAKRKETRAVARAKETLEGGRDRASLPRPTATAARRRRPSSKALDAEAPAELSAGSAAKRTKAATGRGSRRGLEKKPSALREDKREDPNEMVTSAEPLNLKADKNDKKNKGKSTHQLEAREPGQRPSRKSSRGGANHIKPDSQQRRQTTRAVRSPKSRHAMRAT